jgi:hypothetical protein
MQDRYTGDIGDFGKYGLLRELSLPSDAVKGQTLRVGVVWMLVPAETGTGDGKFTAYLVPTDQNLERFMICDPRLYTKARLDCC